MGELLFEGRQEPPDVFQASKPIHATVAAQTRRTPANLKEILEAAGAKLQDVVKCSVFFAYICEFAAMNAVEAGYFNAAKPARIRAGAIDYDVGYEGLRHHFSECSAPRRSALPCRQPTARRRSVTDHDLNPGLEGVLSDDQALQIAMRRVEIAERAFIASRQSADLAARVAKADMDEEMERALGWDRPVPPNSPLMAKIDAALENRRVHALQVLDAMERLTTALTVLRGAMKRSESCQDAAAIFERCVTAMADTTDFADDILPKR